LGRAYQELKRPLKVSEYWERIGKGGPTGLTLGNRAKRLEVKKFNDQFTEVLNIIGKIDKHIATKQKSTRADGDYFFKMLETVHHKIDFPSKLVIQAKIYAQINGD
jgi:hypothetical protein